MIIETIGTTNGRVILQCCDYLDDFDIDVIEIALNKTAEAGGNWQYAKRILNNWIEKKITTVEQIKADDLNFQAKKHKKEKSYEQRDYDNQDLSFLYANNKK